MLEMTGKNERHSVTYNGERIGILNACIVGDNQSGKGLELGTHLLRWMMKDKGSGQPEGKEIAGYQYCLRGIRQLVLTWIFWIEVSQQTQTNQNCNSLHWNREDRLGAWDFINISLISCKLVWRMTASVLMNECFSTFGELVEQFPYIQQGLAMWGSATRLIQIWTTTKVEWCGNGGSGNLRTEEYCWQIVGDIWFGLHKGWNGMIKRCVWLRSGVSEIIWMWYMIEDLKKREVDLQSVGDVEKTSVLGRMHHWISIVSFGVNDNLANAAYSHPNKESTDNCFIWNAIDLCRLITFKYLNLRQSHWTTENSNKPINYEMIFSSRWCFSTISYHQLQLKGILTQRYLQNHATVIIQSMQYTSLQLSWTRLCPSGLLLHDILRNLALNKSRFLPMW